MIEVKNLRKTFDGFVALDDAASNMQEAYAAFAAHHEKKHELRDRLRLLMLRLPRWIPALLETLLLFAGMCILACIPGFRYITHAAALAVVLFPFGNPITVHILILSPT